MTTSNPFNLPERLVGMTQAVWSGMTPAQRALLVDNSHLHPQLVGLEGCTVRVTPKRQYGASTFRVGKTTGWRPAHLAVRRNARGSSDVLSKSERFDSVKVIR